MLDATRPCGEHLRATAGEDVAETTCVGWIHWAAAHGDHGPVPARPSRQYSSIVIELTMPRWAPAVEEDAVALLAVVAEPARWRVLASLAAHGTQCACELEPVAGVATNVLSYHLRALREAGLITSQRRGRWIDYTLVPDASVRLARALPTSIPGAMRELS